jgi:rhamnogalacturonan endolyase
MSDGFKWSDTLRSYGLWNNVPATLTYNAEESNPEEDWYYAQTKNGTWTITFNLDETYTGNAYLTASIAGATNKPKVAVGVNGTNKANWSFSTNDGAIYRSARLGGRHDLKTLTFPASLLKKGENKITLTLSGISGNGGILWDCLKLEAGGLFVVGDANGDGVVDVADVVAITNKILEKPGDSFNFEAADVNADGVIDVSDVVSVVNIILKNP